MDAEGRTYDTLAELHGYAARVAGTVGTMMAILMGRGADDLARAADLGIAMQLTNIARDVGEDAWAGRVYLPLSWLKRSGVTHHSLISNPRMTPASPPSSMRCCRLRTRSMRGQMRVLRAFLAIAGRVFGPHAPLCGYRARTCEA